MVIMLLLFMFGGFYLNISNLPVYTRWIPYTSFISYGARVSSHVVDGCSDMLTTEGVARRRSTVFEILLAVEFRGKTFQCPPPPAVCQFASGDAVCHLYGVSTSGGVIARNIFILLGMAALYRFAAMPFLGYIRPNTQLQLE
jgi:hypothetical protein